MKSKSKKKNTQKRKSKVSLINTKIEIISLEKIINKFKEGRSPALKREE